MIGCAIAGYLLARVGKRWTVLAGLSIMGAPAIVAARTMVRWGLLARSHYVWGFGSVVGGAAAVVESARTGWRFESSLPIVAVGVANAAFASQGVFDSSYGVWPLLMIALAPLAARLVEAAPARRALTIASIMIATTGFAWLGYRHATRHERLGFVNLTGPVQTATLPAIRGLAVPGTHIADFERLIARTNEIIPLTDGVLPFPGEDPFFVASGRRPRLPIVLFDDTAMPFDRARLRQMLHDRSIRWVVVKEPLQLRNPPWSEHVLVHDARSARSLRRDRSHPPLPDLQVAIAGVPGTMTATLIRSARVVTLLLAVAALLGLVVRLPSIAEPLGIDQGLLSSAAQQMARGQLLYRDIFDQKPPGIYLTYLAAFSVFGWNPASVAWLDLAASALIALLLYAVVRELADGVMGAAAAAVYSTLTIPSWLYRHGGFLERSVAETFITVLVGMAAWCAARLVRGGSRSWSLGLGLFGGAAVMYKPNAGGYFVALLIWTLLYDQRDRTRAIGVTLSAIAAAAIVPLATLAWFWIDGVLPEARVALIDFNRAYVATGFSAERYGVDFSKAVWLRMKTDPLWAAGGLASLAARVDFAARGGSRRYRRWRLRGEPRQRLRSW